ncbi:TonB-dependent siderophore receptor [Flavobacterium sp. K5-23]|uniref:TonB-dependent receptor plug domain-containing protein n=1 Tax=Flavobacterium sp. K5-23 TaxID=2746225 RepID=UPI00200D8159|nr:carboxypeptidase-like regulatory domain-containing protein [Flavobacterium sp. K5-23]
MKAIFLFSFLFFCGVEVYAQSDIEVKGTILDQSKLPIIGANLTIIADNTVFNSITDSIGVYSMKIPTGFCSIEVSCIGFVSHYLKENILKDTSLDLILIRDSGALNEVVVLSNSKKSISITSGSKLSFIPSKLASVPSIMGTTDIIKLLQLTPGVQNSGDANGYLYVRGSDPGHNLMLYADATVYGMAHLLGVFPFYNANHIQEVQFDKSNSDPKNGGRLSSTVLVMPNKKVPAEFSVQGNLGLLASQATFSVPLNDKVGLYLSGRKTYIDEIVAPLFESKKNKEDSDVKGLQYGFADGNMTLVAELSKKQLLTIDAFVSGDKLEINDSNLNLNAKLKWSNTVVSSAWKYQVSDAVVMSNAIYFTRYGNNLHMEQATVQMGISSYVQDFGFSNSVRYLINSIPFETGLQYTNHKLQPQKIEVNNLSSNNIDKQAVISTANSLALYTSAKPKLMEKVYAELGLRMNYYLSDKGETTFLHLEPRMLLNYYPHKNTSFFASYTRQNQYLNLITTSSVGIPTDFWVASSDGIPAQSSNEFSVGGSRILTKQFNSSLNGFYRSMNHLIEYPYGVTQFNEITTFKNDILIGNGESYGLEWMLKKDSGRFKGWLSYTLSWSNRQFEEINEGARYYAKYDRRHNLALVGTFDLNLKWDFGLTQIFSSGNRFTMPTSWYFINNNPVKEYGKYNNAQMPNYIRTDLSVNYYFIKTRGRESALNFSIFNTFNIENPIYVVLNVTIDKDKEKIEVKPERKTLYSILPSISWRFKF